MNRSNREGTGLFDSMNQELLEGDIFVIEDFGWQQRFLVFLSEEGYGAKRRKCEALRCLKSHEEEYEYFLDSIVQNTPGIIRIGNIHDNPEMFESF